MVVGDLAVLDDHVMGQHTTHCLVEATANCILWYREVAPGLGMTRAYFIECFIHTIQRDRGSVCLEVCPWTSSTRVLVAMIYLPERYPLVIC
jgi:hypothetical protein